MSTAAMRQTPSQTVGPYFTMRLSAEGENVLSSPESSGQRIRIEGRVFDGDRQHIEDALLEVWQADSAGRYHHPGDDRSDVPLDPAFTGFGRCATDFKTGAYSFLTVKPGQVPHPNGGMQAPHISVTIQARGMLNPTFTRIYFDDQTAANDADPVLQSVPPSRRPTLIATRDSDDESSVPTYRFDIRYQGDDETVFFDV
ncbi:MAG TPA: protocatechuate 3,4-dioxygenase subunit alpha [Ilumatobacteraceae bacterium]